MGSAPENHIVYRIYGGYICRTYGGYIHEYGTVD